MARSPGPFGTIFGIMKVQCPLEVVNLLPSRDVAVLDFSYKFGTNLVCGNDFVFSLQGCVIKIMNHLHFQITGQ